MAIRVALTHSSRYRYDRDGQLQPHVVRLRPAPHCRTPILAYSLRITPEDHFLNWQQDPVRQLPGAAGLPQAGARADVEVDLVAEMTAINPFDFFVEEYAENLPLPVRGLAGARAGALQRRRGRPTRGSARSSRRCTASTRAPDAATSTSSSTSTATSHSALRYDMRMEPGVFEPEETLVRGHGSCRDFAWLEVELLRRLGYAARFVSGYSIQLKPDVKPLDGGPAGVAEDIADLHAWVEVYLARRRLDRPRRDQRPAGRGGAHPAGRHRRAPTAAAISGSFTFNAKKEDDRSKRRRPSRCASSGWSKTPRVTKPYREESVGGDQSPSAARVDQRLSSGYDVRLTMGGEPTFVSIDDRDAPEWNIAALGDGEAAAGRQAVRGGCARGSRRAASCTTARASGTRASRSPAGRYAIYFRKRRRAASGPTPRSSRGARAEPGHQPRRRRPRAGSSRRSPTGSGSARSWRMPAYEDAFYYLWRERRLPVNVNVLE